MLCKVLCTYVVKLEFSGETFNYLQLLKYVFFYLKKGKSILSKDKILSKIKYIELSAKISKL